MSFSVCMAVYGGDKADDFAAAVHSIYTAQTLKPGEIVIVVDGPIPPPLEATLARFSESSPGLFNIVRLPENKGLGNALRIGIEKAKYEIVARMDSDDVSAPDRFEKQIAFMRAHPDVAVVGGQIAEFIGEEENVVGRRVVPCSHEEIRAMLKSRCPFNHMSVAMVRSRVLAVGNYQEWHYNEDYYLWIRMAQAGCRFANLPDTLVNVRVGREMYRRRGGWRYFCSEARLQGYMLRHGLISLPRYCWNVAGRFVVQVAMPNRLRGFVFQKLFRK